MSHGHHPVFAYGSNMHLRDVARWMRERELGEPVVSRVQPALLSEHRLAWTYRSPIREGGAANVLPEPGSQVPGVVLWVDEPTFRALDRKEGYPTRYHRGGAPVALRDVSGGRTAAWVYRVTERWMRPEPELPRGGYLRLMIEAAREHGLPDWHVETLLDTPTVHPHARVVARRARRQDARGIAEVHVRAWQHAYRGLVDDAILDALSVQEGAERREVLLECQTDALTWVAEEGGRIVAFAEAGPSRDDDRPDASELYAMYAHPEAIGRGVGRALLERVRWRHEGLPMILWVLEGNARARRFYRRAGFHPDGTTHPSRWGPTIRMGTRSPGACAKSESLFEPSARLGRPSSAKTCETP